mgnify:CR=1 FL=1
MKKSPATLKSISATLGMAPSTVSRVLNGKAKEYRISEPTAKKVKEEADRVGFSPNQIASSLRLQKTNTMGLVIPDISNNYFATIARALENEARKAGYSIILCDSQGQTELERDAIRLLRGRNIDGLIVAPVGNDAEHLSAFKESGTPIVLVDRYFKEVSIPSVSSDNFQGAYDAVSYMIKHGHTKIGFIQGISEATVNSDRLNGYTKALEDNSIEVQTSYIRGDAFTVESGYQATKQLLEDHADVTAFFAMSNLITLGAMDAIKEKGLEINRDISLISFDDELYFSHLSTPLTAVAQNRTEIGEKAMEILIKLIKDEQVETAETHLPTKLIVRESVRDIK